MVSRVDSRHVEFLLTFWFSKVVLNVNFEGIVYSNSTPSLNFWTHVVSSSGPASWNSLPPALRHQSVSLQYFKHSLKTFLFNV